MASPPDPVSGQKQHIRLFQLFLYGVNMLLALRQDCIFRLEVVFDIHRSLLAGQGSHMTKGCQDFVVRTEKFFDGFGLGRRFDDDKVLGHSFHR